MLQIYAINMIIGICNIQYTLVRNNYNSFRISSQRHSYQYSRQRRRKRHKMDECHRLELLHLQRPNPIRQTSRMLLRSCKKELPRQTHQNRQIRWRSWLGRKLLHPKKNTMPRSPHRKLLHGQSFWPRVSAKYNRQTSHHRHPRRRHHRIPHPLTLPRHPRPDRGSPKAKPHAAIRQHGAFLLSSSKRSSPPAL